MDRVMSYCMGWGRMIKNDATEMRICTKYIRHLYCKYGAGMVLYAVANVIPREELDPAGMFETGDTNACSD